MLCCYFVPLIRLVGSKLEELTMSYKNDVKGLFEPGLVAIFERLNQQFFDGKLSMPAALCYDYRPVGSKRRSGRGGQILSTKDGSHCYYIVVRGKQKGNVKFEEETILHEMVHLSLYERFFTSKLWEVGYRIHDFSKDSSASFILECARVAIAYGCTYKELASWSIKDSPDNDTTVTSKRYNEVQAAKALLG